MKLSVSYSPDRSLRPIQGFGAGEMPLQPFSILFSGSFFETHRVS